MNKINPGHRRERSILRVIGPLVLITGVIFTIIGITSFFASFGTFGPPKYFWCAFIGLPLSGFGMMLCKFAFMGKVARYAAGELAPVGKDTFNYMARGTQEGVRNFSRALFSGSSMAGKGTIEERIRKLEELRQAGLIDDEDFEQQKDRILTEV